MLVRPGRRPVLTKPDRVPTCNSGVPRCVARHHHEGISEPAIREMVTVAGRWVDGVISGR